MLLFDFFLCVFQRFTFIGGGAGGGTGPPMTKSAFSFRGAKPPWQAALPPDPRYRLVLRTRHGAPQPLTPSATCLRYLLLKCSNCIAVFMLRSALIRLHCLCMWVFVHLHHFPGVVCAYVAPDMQWCIAKNGGGYMQRAVEKGLKVPCLFMITNL